MSLGSLFASYNTNSNKLALFLNEKHPYLHSLLDLDVEKTEKQWIWWLNKKGIRTTQTTTDFRNGELKNKSVVANFFRLVYENYLISQILVKNGKKIDGMLGY